MPFFIVRQDSVTETDVIVRESQSKQRDREDVFQESLILELELRGASIGKEAEAKGDKRVINLATPICQEAGTARQAVKACYMSALRFAKERKAESITFPLLKAKESKLTVEKALESAKEAIQDFLLDHEMAVYLIVEDDKSLWQKGKFAPLNSFINEHYIEDTAQLSLQQVQKSRAASKKIAEDNAFADLIQKTSPREHVKTQQNLAKESSMQDSQCDDCDIEMFFDESDRVCPEACEVDQIEGKIHNYQSFEGLDELLKNAQLTFSQYLLKLIDERGLSDAEVYKRANIDRKLFSKIRGDKDYRPSKVTAVAFAIALRLSADDTRDLLLRAGFALNKSSKFDLIIQYFIERKTYDFYLINEALFAFDQVLLGV